VQRRRAGNFRRARGDSAAAEFTFG